MNFYKVFIIFFPFLFIAPIHGFMKFAAPGEKEKIMKQPFARLSWWKDKIRNHNTKSCMFNRIDYYEGAGIFNTRHKRTWHLFLGLPQPDPKTCQNWEEVMFWGMFTTDVKSIKYKYIKNSNSGRHSGYIRTCGTNNLYTKANEANSAKDLALQGCINRANEICNKRTGGSIKEKSLVFQYYVPKLHKKYKKNKLIKPHVICCAQCKNDKKLFDYWKKEWSKINSKGHSFVGHPPVDSLPDPEEIRYWRENPMYHTKNPPGSTWTRPFRKDGKPQCCNRQACELWKGGWKCVKHGKRPTPFGVSGR